MRIRTILSFSFLFIFALAFAGGDNGKEDGHDHAQDQGHNEQHELSCDNTAHDHGFDAGSTAFHHISDANVYSIGPLQIPLPCILYNKDSGSVDFFLSSKFGFDKVGHGDGHYAFQGYVLDGGTVKMIA